MATDTKIEWCHHTFNPWRGCTKVSAGCANCYAETMSKRNPKVLGIWGDNGTRVVASEAMWREPLKWNEQASRMEAMHARHTELRDPYERPRVFCASLADVCEDRPDLIAPRLRLKQLIYDTPHLDWLLLSKRPENYLRLFWGPNAGEWPGNVWAGTSVENQATADERIPHLLRCPAAVRFLSVEPLLGPIDLHQWIDFGTCNKCGYVGEGDRKSGGLEHMTRVGNRCRYLAVPVRSIDWVIVGGESGGGARPSEIAWHRSIIKQCKAAGMAVFEKQLGRRFLIPNDSFSKWPRDGDVLINYDQREGSRYQGELIECGLDDPKGGDMAEWPEDLRVREFPKAVQP